ncbi:MAG: hypothetical protein O8C67_00265 [Candidatus Methanoperedens sp.]|nr:hypothetical protein [Candidatus Methanoperedens sp.]
MNMKLLSIFLILLISVGMVSAQGSWFGGGAVSGGAGTFTGNVDIGGDLAVTGDTTLTGSLSVGGATLSNGIFSEDISMAAGYDFYTAAGAEAFDWSNSTGAFKTTTGPITLGGGTNGVNLNGPVTGASAKSWTMVGASTLVLGSTGIDPVGGVINFLDGYTGTTGNLTGTLQAEQITSTDDATISDDLAVLGSLAVTETATAEQLTSTDDATIGDALDVVGALTAGTIVSDGIVTATTTVQGSDVVATDDLIAADDLVVDGLARIDEGLTVASVASNGSISGTAITGSGIIQAEQLTSTDDAQVYDTLTTNILVVNTSSTASDQIANDDLIAADDLVVDGLARIDEGLTVNSIVANTSVQGADTIATDDVIGGDDLVIDGAARIDETATINALVVNTTAGVTGLSTFSAIALGINATTSISTVLTSANLKTVYGMDGSGGSVTLTLPDATTVAGRPYMIGTAVDMVGNNIVVETTGAAKLGGATGADTLTSTDAAAALQVVSDGTNYLVIAKVGTWT